MKTLFYRTAPTQWMEGLPIGNGRLAGMVWGNQEDCLTLNHEWLWKGVNRFRKTEESADQLPEVRRLIREGRHYEAALRANRAFGGSGGISGIRGRVDPYQPAGELHFSFSGVPVFVSRNLDLITGLVSVKRSVDSALLCTEFFADCNDGCLSVCWKSKKPFSGILSLTREPEEGTSLTFSSDKDTLQMNGTITGGICFAVRVKILTDGVVLPQKDRLAVTNASEIRCFVNMATDHEDLFAELLAHTPSLANFDAVRTGHIEKFRREMEKIDFMLEENEADGALTADQRIQNIKSGKTDNGISQLYFDYARYLLLSSSVCGQLPANLQGKWNDSLTPPWDCDYHFDINLEMNYWIAEPAGLGCCVPALVQFVRSFLSSGKEAAKRLYGCRGVYLPIQTDAWGNATPESYGWAVWIGAAPWIARHLWDHYRYTGDIEYLRTEAYEFFKLTAEFYEDYLELDSEGIYQILPSQSPENTIAETREFPVLIDQSSAMDVQLCYDSLGYAIRSAEILGTDAEQVRLWKHLRDNLPPFSVGTDGRLMEWQKEYAEREPGHRHMSHLYGIYPSDLFTPETRPEQYTAGKRSFAVRMSHGGGHTGWSRAWSACLAARFGDSEMFIRHYTALIRDFATLSLLNLHPPHIFQIEGNFGGAAAVIEAIVSYYDDTAHLLHSLPEEWASGHLYGIRIPGGHILQIAWDDRKLSSVSIVMGFEREARIAWDGILHTVTGTEGQKIVLL